MSLYKDILQTSASDLADLSFERKNDIAKGIYETFMYHACTQLGYPFPEQWTDTSSAGRGYITQSKKLIWHSLVSGRNDALKNLERSYLEDYGNEARILFCTRSIKFLFLLLDKITADPHMPIAQWQKRLPPSTHAWVDMSMEQCALGAREKAGV